MPRDPLWGHVALVVALYLIVAVALAAAAQV